MLEIEQKAIFIFKRLSYFCCNERVYNCKIERATCGGVESLKLPNAVQVSYHAHNAINLEKEKLQLLQISNIIMN
jgi:hypothetical protein